VLFHTTVLDFFRDLSGAEALPFAGRVGPQGRIETKNGVSKSPSLVSIRPSAYSTDGLALCGVAQVGEKTQG
jgi:hypothetical protein